MQEAPAATSNARIRRLAASLLFCALVFAELAYAGAVLKPAKPLWPTFLALPRNTVDVVVFGNSHVFDGIDPNVFWQSEGIAGCDMAGPRQPLQLTQHYVAEVLKTQRPRVAVVEVSSLAYDHTAYDTQFQQTSVGYMPWGTPKLAAAFLDTPAKDRSSVLIDVWTYHTRWNELKRADFTLANLRPPRDVMRGYTPLMKTVEMTRTTVANVTLTASDIATATANLPALESIARTCDENGVRLLLVLTPTAPPGLNTWRLELARKQLQPRFPSLRTLDLSAPGAVPGLDFKTDFFDPGHPTYAGAAKVSARLAEYLASTYGIRDRRGDAAYAQWERDAREHDAILRKKGAKQVYGERPEKSRSATGAAR